MSSNALISPRWPSSLRTISKLVVLTILAGCCAARANAELTWKQLAVDLHADAKSTVLEARFPFTNSGKTPVDISQVESSCGCTVATLEKRHYEPQESGEIVAKYTVGTAVGTQRKTVEVETNDGREPTVLTLIVEIPEVLRIKPPFLSWKHGEASGGKTIILEMVQDVPVNHLSVQSTTEVFITEIKTLVPGRKYALSVRPQSTEQRQFATLNIRCQFGDEEKIFRAYATVRPPEIKD